MQRAWTGKVDYGGTEELFENVRLQVPFDTGTLPVVEQSPCVYGSCVNLC